MELIPSPPSKLSKTIVYILAKKEACLPLNQTGRCNDNIVSENKIFKYKFCPFMSCSGFCLYLTTIMQQCLSVAALNRVTI